MPFPLKSFDGYPIYKAEIIKVVEFSAEEIVRDK
jgi:hypothetical protein